MKMTLVVYGFIDSGVLVNGEIKSTRLAYELQNRNRIDLIMYATNIMFIRKVSKFKLMLK